MNAMARKAETVRAYDACPSHPHEGLGHDCMDGEMRCVYCGKPLEPRNCNGCGRFLKCGDEMVIGRCEACQ